MPDAPLLLPNSLLESVLQGLSELDGLRNAHEFTPFNFDADTTWLIADNAVAVRRALETYTVAKKSLAKKHDVKDGMQVRRDDADGMARVAAFLEELDGLNAREVSVSGLKKVSRASLSVGRGKDKNAIMASTLAKLGAILE
jgi:hypothetical protein